MTETAVKTLLVGIGGFLGANARYWLATAIQRWLGDAFPWATFAINVSGTLALGFLLELCSARCTEARFETLRLLTMVGFLGAYTTFSTFEMEAFTLIHGGAALKAALYLVGSVLCGLLAAAIGVGLARMV